MRIKCLQSNIIHRESIELSFVIFHYFWRKSQPHRNDEIIAA